MPPNRQCKYLVFNLAARARVARKQIISPLKLGSWTDTELSTYRARERAAVRSSFFVHCRGDFELAVEMFAIELNETRED
jgi:hypothetical protein